MAGLEDILKNLPIGDIAKQLGVNTDQAEEVVGMALPALLGGMQANAQDEKGAASLNKALNKHAGKNTKTVKVSEVDTEDGQKIVRNIFGQNTDQVVSTLAEVENKKSAGLGDLLPQVLPILAPIVMGFLANQFAGKSEEEAKPNNNDGGLAGILGGLLGGGSNNSQQQDGNPLGGLIGGLFGGGNSGSSNGNGAGDLIGGLLGGLLGGGKR